MFLPVVVLDWRIDGGRRVPDAIGNLYVLNTNRMYQITIAYDGHPTMIFYDNPANVKDAGARMRIDTTLAGLLNGADSDHGSESVTLDYYPDNDTSVATKEITLSKADIAYCYPFGNQQSNALSWVIYSSKGWNMERILVNHSWIPLYSNYLEH
jgi:hypothetical protein